VLVPLDRLPGLPGDPQDDRRDAKADQRVGDRDTERDDYRAGDDGKADVGVGSGVVAVGHQGRAIKASSRAESDLGRDPVPHVADGAGDPKDQEVVRSLWVDEAQDRLDAGHARRNEDGRHDEQARNALGARRAPREGHPERDRRGGVAEVVDQVGEQGDAAAGTKISVWMAAATASTTSDAPTARTPSRERLMLGSTSP
jgi:hypothetical protein